MPRNLRICPAFLATKNNFLRIFNIDKIDHKNDYKHNKNKSIILLGMINYYDFPFLIWLKIFNSKPYSLQETLKFVVCSA